VQWPDANPDQDRDDGQNDQATCSADRTENCWVRDELQGEEAHQRSHRRQQENGGECGSDRVQHSLEQFREKEEGESADQASEDKKA
jgi:hypothetical protein